MATTVTTLRAAALASALALGAAVGLGALLGPAADGTAEGLPSAPRADGELPSDYQTAAVVEAARVTTYLEAAAAAAEEARAAEVAAARTPADPPAPAPLAPAPLTPEPPVPPAPGSIEELVCATFGAECAGALRVVGCESNFNPGTVGAAGERGLFQIHPVHIPYLAERGMSWDAMFDPAANIAYAWDLYSRSGWGPWTCKP